MYSCDQFWENDSITTSSATVIAYTCKYYSVCNEVLSSILMFFRGEGDWYGLTLPTFIFPTLIKPSYTKP